MSIGFDISRALLWIVLLPLLGALINGVAGRNADKKLVTGVAVGSVGGAFLLSLMTFGHLLMAGEEGSQRLVHDVYEWFSISVRGVDVPIRVRFVMDHLSGIMTVMVTGIGALIHVYSVGYMEEDPGYARFMTYLNLFMASMLILVLASNLPLMFVGWEGVGLCSYLLIGFWYTHADYAAAGKKAFIVNRIGDFGVLIGMFLLVAAVADPRTPDAFEFAQINAVATRLGLTEVSFGATAAGVSVATAATLFLFLGCTGKSAQIPLYVWLPDAMAGPTPVSALIHAATMVTAGVYLCCRLSPVIVESPVGMSVIAVVGALTALLAASIALVQNQMKKILAYSTVSQLGFMFAAVGMGAFAGGIFHVFTHAFFKACLFLGAGSVMHAVHAHGDADIRYLGGLRKYMPATHATFAVATAAIAGVPLLSGFFSKDEILLGAATWGAASPFAPWVGWTVFGILVLAATMTAFYMFRLYFRTFWGNFKGGHPPEEHDGHHGAEHSHAAPHESPETMTVPLYVLAAGAAVAGFLGLPHAFHLPNWWGEWLTPTSVASLQFEGRAVHAPEWIAFLAMGLGTAAALGGIGLSYAWYFREGNPTPARLVAQMSGFHRLLMDKWRVDEAYDFLIVSPMKWLAVFAANVDRFFIDGLLARASAALMQAGGWLLTRTQSGVIYAYGGLFVLGFAILGWWFTYPHAYLAAEPSTGTIQWNASEGLGYEYRWDFDSDGEWDTDWTDESAPTHSYDGAAYYGLVGILESPGDMFGPTEIEALPGAAPVEIPVDRLGPTWTRAEASDRGIPPTLQYATVHAYEGQLPASAVPEPDERGHRIVELEAILSTTGGEPRRLWSERQTVRVSEDGTYTLLLGLREPLRPSQLPPRVSLRVTPGGEPTEVVLHPQTEMVLRINDAAINDRDGTDDGLVTLAPGESIALPGARLTVAVQVRGTVEIRNAFGNLARGSEDVTLRVSRRTGRAGVDDRAPRAEVQR